MISSQNKDIVAQTPNGSPQEMERVNKGTRSVSNWLSRVGKEASVVAKAASWESEGQGSSHGAKSPHPQAWSSSAK